MLIISFAWTTAALLTGAKTCTRRNWTERYAQLFKAGMVVQGWDRLPRAGGQKVAEVRMIAEPYPEWTGQMPERDYKAEGLEWMEKQGLRIRGLHPREFWEQWKAADELVSVVRFQLVKVLVPLALYLPQ